MRHVRVIALRTLRLFWEKPGHEDAEGPLRAWYREAEAAHWNTPTDIQRHYRTASVLKAGRVVFNIKGNKYRLVVKIVFEAQRIYVRFVGTHEEYDRIDANSV